MPSGLSLVFSKYGGMPPMITALVTPLCSVLANITRHFAATHRKADQREIAQVEVCNELVEVLREGVVIVSGCWLAGFAESSAVVGDDALTRLQKDRNLLLPGCTVERVAMDQNYRVTGPVVLVIELDVTGVFFTDRNIRHGGPPFVLLDASGGSLFREFGISDPQFASRSMRLASSASAKNNVAYPPSSAL